MKIALLSSKGQITLPKDILKSLQIGHKSKLALYPQRGVLLIKPLRSSIVEQTAGSLKHFIPKEKKGIPYSEVREKVHRDVARILVEKE